MYLCVYIYTHTCRVSTWEIHNVSLPKMLIHVILHCTRMGQVTDFAETWRCLEIDMIRGWVKPRSNLEHIHIHIYIDIYIYIYTSIWTYLWD